MAQDELSEGAAQPMSLASRIKSNPTVKKVGLGIAGVVAGLLAFKGINSVAGSNVSNASVIDRWGIPPILVLEKMGSNEYLVQVSKREYVPLGDYLESLDLRKRYLIEAKIEGAIQDYNSKQEE